MSAQTATPETETTKFRLVRTYKDGSTLVQFRADRRSLIRALGVGGDMPAEWTEISHEDFHNNPEGNCPWHCEEH